MPPPTNAEIRAWAREQGMVVADRGRLPGHVLAAYAEAHGDTGLPADAFVATDTAPATVPPAEAGPAVPDDETSVWQTSPAQQDPTGWDAVPHPTRETDGFAIASLVLGLLGGVLLSVIFGVLALRRIKKSGSGGRRLALGGLAASGVWLVIIAIAVAAAVSGSADRDDSGKVTARGDVTIDDLRVGDCTAALPEGEVLTVTVSPCDDPHAAEAFAAFDLEGEDYPGQEDVDRFAEGGCSRELEQALTEDDATAYELFFFTPTEVGWKQGDREVICVVTGPEGGDLVGSVKEGPAREQ